MNIGGIQSMTFVQMSLDCSVFIEDRDVRPVSNCCGQPNN